MRFLICSFAVLFFSYCNSNQERSSRDIYQDDVERIKELVRSVYRWEDSIGSKTIDFNFTGNDSLYIELDRKTLLARIEQLKNTNFFSREFLKNYESLGFEMEKKLKDGSVKYYVGEVPPFALDASSWCNCQDIPENYIEKMQFENIKMAGDSASFNWTWGGGFQYKMRAKKENGDWRICYMEGFDPQNLFE